MYLFKFHIFWGSWEIHISEVRELSCLFNSAEVCFFYTVLSLDICSGEWKENDRSKSDKLGKYP